MEVHVRPDLNFTRDQADHLQRENVKRFKRERMLRIKYIPDEIENLSLDRMLSAAGAAKILFKSSRYLERINLIIDIIIFLLQGDGCPAIGAGVKDNRIFVLTREVHWLQAESRDFLRAQSST